MATLLMGHGEAIAAEQVIVPPWMQISFLIDEARIMPFSSAVGVVLNSEVLQQQGFAVTSTHSGGEPISNHRLSELTTRQRAWFAQVDPEDGSCMYAGQDFDSGLRLCNDPGPESQCDQVEGVHTCGGLFSFTWSDPHLVWVSCRQDIQLFEDLGVMSMPQATVAGQPSDSFTFAGTVLRELKTNPEGFPDYFGALEPEEKAIALTQADVRRWSALREARKWLRGGEATDLTFYRFVEAPTGTSPEDSDRDLYLGDPDLKSTYERGKFVHVAGEYLASSGTPAFLEFARGLTPDARALLRQDQSLVDLVEQVEDEIAAAADRV